jgi:protein TonB
MNLKNYTTPAIVAAAAHATLFLVAPDIPAVVPDEPGTVLIPVGPSKMDPLPPPLEPKEGEEPAVKNVTRGEAVPSLPEEIVIVRDGFTTPAPPVVPTDHYAKSPTKIPAMIGDPNGNADVLGGLFGPQMLLRGDLDREPRYRARPAPDYPFAARQSGLEGEVVVEFDVDAAGSVAAARVLRSTDRMFEEPAIRAVLKWRFESGRKNGRAVAFRMAVPIVFSLKNS